MNIQSPGIVSLFNHFQEYLGIFRGVDPYLTRGKRGDPFLPILKIEKSVLILTIGLNFWVKFFIQNVVLIVPRRKNLKMFPVEPFFLVFF